MPYVLDTAGGESAIKHSRERRERRAGGIRRDWQWALGPPVSRRVYCALVFGKRNLEDILFPNLS
jgi:hypothetical protein